jgi:hypothetical protein
MTRKNAITILIIVLALSGLFIVYILVSSSKDSGINPGKNINSTGEGSYFPTSSLSENIGDTEHSEDLTNIEGIKSVPKLRQIASSPVSGFTTFERDLTEIVKENLPSSAPVQTQTIYRYVDRATGNVFETNENSLKINRVTNVTIPKVYEAQFFTAGEGVILRYLDEKENIETYVARIVSENATTTQETNLRSLQGIFLPKNVTAITKDPSSDKFFFTKDTKGYIFEGSSPQNQVLVLDYAITEWLINWVKGEIILTTKPSYFSPGFAFTVNPISKTMRNLFSNKLGLLVNSNNDLTKILVSEYVSNSISTSVFDSKTGESKLLEIKTLADKCVWSKKNLNTIYCAVPQNLTEGKYPDEWYQGAVSFIDVIYKIDLEEDTVSKFDSLSSDTSFDIQEIQLSEQEEYLVFQNKKDLTVWSLNITK